MYFAPFLLFFLSFLFFGWYRAEGSRVVRDMAVVFLLAGLGATLVMVIAWSVLYA